MAVANVPDPKVVAVLSTPRFSRYLAAASGDTPAGLDLYAWNAQISAALMVPAHFAEIATRNAAADALEEVYGDRWPWAPGFVQSLPNPPRAARTFNPRQNLLGTARQHETTGKVIAELKFVFWGKLFTSRHDQRLWGPHIQTLFPNASPDLSAGDLRQRIADDIEAIRALRNRIAHHEPIHTRDLEEDLARMLDLIELRCTATAEWVRSLETAYTLLASRP